MTWPIQIIITAGFAWLILWTMHWFNWRLALRRDPPPILGYILGTLGWLIPLTVLFSIWVKMPPANLYAHLIALWSLVISGGMAVMSAHFIDWIIKRMVQVPELEEINHLYQEQLNDAQGQIDNSSRS
jgi:hypothetical protein